MPGYDRALDGAIAALRADYSRVTDRQEIDDQVSRAVAGFNQAAIRGQVPEGFQFDANRVRRELAFNLLYQRLVDDMLSGIGKDVALPGTGYRVTQVRDELDRRPHRAIVHKRIVVGAEQGLHNPVAAFRWGIPDDRFALVAGRDAVFAAKQLAQASMATTGPAPTRGRAQGLA